MNNKKEKKTRTLKRLTKEVSLPDRHSLHICICGYSLVHARGSSHAQTTLYFSVSTSVFLLLLSCANFFFANQLSCPLFLQTLLYQPITKYKEKTKQKNRAMGLSNCHAPRTKNGACGSKPLKRSTTTVLVATVETNETSANFDGRSWRLHLLLHLAGCSHQIRQEDRCNEQTQLSHWSRFNNADCLSSSKRLR